MDVLFREIWLEIPRQMAYGSRFIKAPWPPGCHQFKPNCDWYFKPVKSSEGSVISLTEVNKNILITKVK